jgi:hypothetical protein
MSKKNNEVVSDDIVDNTESPIVTETTDEQATEGDLSAFVNQLRQEGRAILSASTREQLAEMVNNIPADCKYGVGAVGQNPESGLFTMQIDIVKN